MMTLTTAQIFQIGGILIGLITALAPLFGLDPKLTATAGGAIASAWAAIGATLTGTTAQVREVAALPGVDAVKINNNALPGLKQLAADPNVNVEK